MRTNKKPHFEAPSPAAQACLLPRRYAACYGTRMPRLSCRGHWRPCLPRRQAGCEEGSNWPRGTRDRKARWEVLAHDCRMGAGRGGRSDSGQGLSPYLWMLSGME